MNNDNMEYGINLLPAIPLFQQRIINSAWLINYDSSHPILTN